MSTSSSSSTSSSTKSTSWTHTDQSKYNHFILVDNLPYVTSPSLSIGGTIKFIPSYFQVTELPPPSPDGISHPSKTNDSQACHFWLVIQRASMNTYDVQMLLSTLLGYPDAKEIGICGLKDKHAVTIQTFSVPSFSRTLSRHVTSTELVEIIHQHSESNLIVLGTPQISSKKLRRNLHTGNRFKIVVGNLSTTNSTEALEIANTIKTQLLSSGWPNYYGEQRFGKGTASAVRGARLLELLQSKGGGSRKRLRTSIMKSTHKMLILSAHSSMYFNIWLSKRIEKNAFDKLLDGDLTISLDTTIPTPKGKWVNRYVASNLQKDDGKGTMKEGQEEGIQNGGTQKNSITNDNTNDTNNNNNTMLSEFETNIITYTGPMYGFRLDVPNENTQARAIEDEVSRLSTTEQTTYKMLSIYGTRRIGRLSLTHMNLEIAKHKEGLVFSFDLPKGSYATAFLREFMKVPVGRCLPDTEEEKEDDGDYDDDNQQGARKKIKKMEPRRPMTFNEFGINNVVTKMEPTTWSPKYKMFLLRSTHGKIRNITFCLFSLNHPRSIKDFSAVLSERKTMRMANEKDMTVHLGCKLSELSPFSVLSKPCVPTHVSVAIDSVLKGDCNFKYLEQSCISMSVDDYKELLVKNGVTVATVEF